MSSARSRGLKGAKTGKNWESQILFYQSSGKTNGPAYLIDDHSLIDGMSDLIDDSEMIQRIWVYKCPLSSRQSNQPLLNHQFVVIETRKWSWSIEKNVKNIIIQRDKQLLWVRDFKVERNDVTNQLESGVRLTPIEQLSYDQGRKSMKDLIEFLYHKDELNKKYDWLDDNCQDFAKRIFDEFAERKFHGKENLSVEMIGGITIATFAAIAIMTIAVKKLWRWLR